MADTKLLLDRLTSLPVRRHGPEPDRHVRARRRRVHGGASRYPITFVQ